MEFSIGKDVTLTSKILLLELNDLVVIQGVLIHSSDVTTENGKVVELKHVESTLQFGNDHLYKQLQGTIKSSKSKKKKEEEEEEDLDEIEEEEEEDEDDEEGVEDD